MSWFDIHLTQVARIRGQLDGVKSQIRALEGQMNSVKSQIDRHMSESGYVDPALDTTLENLRRRQRSLESLSTSLANIIQVYDEAENRIRSKDMPAISSWSGRRISITIPGFTFSNSPVYNNRSLNGSGTKDHPNSQDPVNLGNGNFIDGATDLVCGRGFVFKRFYNSQGNKREGILGKNWSCNIECRLLFDKDQGRDRITVILEDGQEIPFIKADDGTWYVLAQTEVTLQNEAALYIFTARNHSRYIFDEKGKFLRFEDTSHVGFSLNYSDTTEGRLIGVNGDNGEALTLEYDEAGYLRCVADSTGRVFSYFVSGGLLLHTEAPDGAAWTYGYTDNGLLQTSMDPEGNMRVQNTYDDKCRVTEQVFADNSTTKFAYDDEKGCVIETERDGSVRTYYHDEDGKVYRIVYPDSEWQCEYDDRGNRILTKDRNGNITRFSYDIWGNITKEIRADGSVMDMTYGAHAIPMQVKMNGMVRMRNSFNDDGKLIHSEDALGRHTDYQYEGGRLVACTLQDNSVLHFRYDDSGNVTGITLPNGGNIAYTYDELSRVVAVRDPNGNLARFIYDINGNLSALTNAKGERQTYEYDKNGNIRKIIDPAGNTWERYYNALTLPDSEIDAAGRKTSYTYDAMWNIATVTSPAGAVTSFKYDQNNRLCKIQDAEGGEVSYCYDANGNRISETDAEGAVARYDYDEMGRLFQVVSGQSALLLEYDADGNLTAVTGAGGSRVEMEYDAAGQRTSERTPEGAERHYTYDQFGNIASVEDENGNRTEYQYGAGGRELVQVRYPEGATESYEYDLNGNLTKSVEAAGKVTTYCYDAMNRVIEKSDGELTHYYSYDVLGRLVMDKDSVGGHTEYAYSVTGQLTQIIDTKGNKAVYTYDADDHLIRVEQTGDPKEPVRFTDYTRDLLGRLLSVTDANGRKDQFTYNKRGDLISRLDPDGYLTKFEYTDNRQLHRVTYDDGREASFAYDALSAVKEITDWNGTTAIENNQFGRPVKVSYPDGSTVGYTYDNTGCMTSMTYPDGLKAEYQYDKYGRLSAIFAGDQRYQYHYDALGRLKEKDIPGQLVTTYSFNALNQLTSMISSDAEGELDSDTFEYDPYGRKTAIRRKRRGLPEQSGLFTFEYDALHRLTRVARDGQQVREYQYDSFSNRIGKFEYLAGIQRQTTYQYDAANQLLQEVMGEVVRKYDYDGRGNLTSISENGCNIHQYKYDTAGHLASAVNSEGLQAQYYYNGLGARIGRDVFRGEERIGRIRYVRDVNRAFHNLLSSTEENNRDDFLYDYGPIGMIRATGDESRHFCSYLQDHVGSPVRIMDSDGTELDSLAYDEFGTLLKGNADIQPFGYTGYILDDIAGTYYAQAREYLPTIGIFTGRDLVPGDIRYPQGLNRYRYANNDPEDYVDNNGQEAIVAALIIVVGGIVGSLTNAASNTISQLVEMKKEPVTHPSFDWGSWSAELLAGIASGMIDGAAVAGAEFGPVYTSSMSALGSAVDSFLTDTLTDWTHGEKIEWKKAWEDAGISGGVSLAFSAIKAPLKNLGFVQKFSEKFIDPIKENIFHTNFDTKEIVKILNGWNKEVYGGMWNQMLKILIGQQVLDKVIDLGKGLIKDITGFKSVKNITKDLLKSWCPWYKDKENDKSWDQYWNDYASDLKQNTRSIAYWTGKMSQLLPLKNTYFGSTRGLFAGT